MICASMLYTLSLLARIDREHPRRQIREKVLEWRGYYYFADEWKDGSAVEEKHRGRIEDLLDL